MSLLNLTLIGTYIQCFESRANMSLFFFLILCMYAFIYLFLPVLGLRFCERALSNCGKPGPLFIAVRGPPTIVASPVAEHWLQTRRLSSCGSRAQLLRGTRDPPRPGLEPMSPVLAGRFSTTAPPGKSHFGQVLTKLDSLGFRVCLMGLIAPSLGSCED